MPPILSADGLSKCYRVMRGGVRNDWITAGILRRTLALGRRLLMPWRRGHGLAPPAHDTLWSLADVSFEVGAGEVVGIVGHNGAGKTTLLRVLAGITDPTRGSALVRGRITSLLDVGIGFHGELSGRENTYMKAAMHGMRRELVDKRLEAIVDFAEIGPFLDTPLKRYSSGMRSRLALAIALELEHEVMVVDEALAVGDARFRQRAMERIRGLTATSGATTLFVSHDLGLVRELCPRSLLLERGRLTADGPTNEVLDRYLRAHTEDGSQALRRFRPGETRFLRGVRLLGADGVVTGRFVPGAPLSVELLVGGIDAAPDLEARVVLSTPDGRRLLRFRSAMVGLDLGEGLRDETSICADLALVPLTPGHYTVGVELGRGTGLLEKVDHALRFEVIPGDPYGRGEHFVSADGAFWAQGTWRRGPPLEWPRT